MSFTPEPLCKVCQAVQKDPELMDLIYKSRFFMGDSGLSIKQIADKYQDQFAYPSILKHVKKHQTLNSEEFNERRMRSIRKRAENRAIKQEIKAITVWDEVMQQGLDQLRSGNMKIKATDLLKAAKDKSDTQMKKKDQELATIEMVMHFASGESERIESKKYDRRIIEGENVTNFDPTRDLAGSDQRRQDQSSDFYQSLAGNSFTPWSDEVPGGDPEARLQDQHPGAEQQVG